MKIVLAIFAFSFSASLASACGKNFSGRIGDSTGVKTRTSEAPSSYGANKSMNAERTSSGRPR